MVWGLERLVLKYSMFYKPHKTREFILRPHGGIKFLASNCVAPHTKTADISSNLRTCHHSICHLHTVHMMLALSFSHSSKQILLSIAAHPGVERKSVRFINS